MIDTEIQDEIQKCMNNPYYFATTYIMVNGKPFTTTLSETVFNKYFDRQKELDFIRIKARRSRS